MGQQLEQQESPLRPVNSLIEQFEIKEDWEGKCLQKAMIESFTHRRSRSFFPLVFFNILLKRKRLLQTHVRGELLERKVHRCVLP